ncbi:MAG: PIN domain protein [Candidatus Schekmanbacteria bacterium]|nr:PIN domain protein [Candidatus Schekmanbacteria bacterium]
MRIYLDNCCYNRPFDDQSQIRIRLEAEAKLYVQDSVRRGDLELVWSYILDFENEANPFEERRSTIMEWRQIAKMDVEESGHVLQTARVLQKSGLRAKDALHVSCAIAAGCQYFITTYDIIIKRLQGNEEITGIDPIGFVKDTSQ